MCFHFQQTKSAEYLATRFKANFTDADSFVAGIYNGFTHPYTPVIIDSAPKLIQLFRWGLVPHWAKDDGIKKYTLNARSETIDKKPSFKQSVNKHCLILADGFFEWQWLDEKGKNKQKYLLHLPNDQAFGFAGLWSNWQDPVTGNLLHTYTILTMEANALMSKIHNNKKRMPIIVAPGKEQDWLTKKDVSMANNYLIAKKL